jgi:hypothetical protein
MPDVSELLATWEAGVAADDAGRALLLHALARPDADGDALLRAPVGRRDTDLFALRRRLFGSRVQVRLSCPRCDEELEAPFNVDGLADAPPADPEPLRVTVDGWSVLLRLPAVGDLRALAGSPDPVHARGELLSRCVLEASRDGVETAAADLPVSVQRRLAAAVAAADPYADVRLDLGCPGCGQRTKAVLDIASFLWSELDVWARATLLDVHLLATAYGWSEPEVLALTPWRRRYYLELSGNG